MKVGSLTVGLAIVGYEYNYTFGSWMAAFLSGCDGDPHSFYHHALPYIVLRAGASALLVRPDQELYMTLEETFSFKQLDLTPEGLACLVDVCNAVLHPEHLYWPGGVPETS